MTTATTTTATDRHEELGAALAAAQAERDEIKQKAHEYRGRIHALRERLLGRSIDAPAEFGSTGSPKKGTEAAKNAAEIHKLIEVDDFDSAIHGAEVRVERARVELRRHIDQGARALLAEMLPACEEAVAEFVAWASQGSEYLARLAELQHRSSSLCHESRTFDVRSVPDYDHWVRLVHDLATGAPALPLPAELVAELKQADDE